MLTAIPKVFLHGRDGMFLELWEWCSSGAMSERVQAIQAMRGIAATMVVAGHLSIMANDVSGHAPFFGTIMSVTKTFGHAGVDVFFVISGAIMFMITQSPRHSAATAETVDFLLRRLLRIYPLFWVTLAVMVLGVGNAFPDTALAAFRSLALVDMPPAHPVAWTMVFEVRFYVEVAAVILFFHGRMGRAFLLWAALEILAVVATSYGKLPLVWISHPLMLEFVMGTGVGYLVSRKFTGGAPAALALGLAGFVYTAAFVFDGQNVEAIRVWGYGLPAAIILYAFVAMEMRRTVRVPLWLSNLGEASYSLYLWHLPIFLLWLPHWLQGGTSGGFGFAISATLTLAVVAALSYRFIERPFIALAAMRFRSHPQFPTDGKVLPPIGSISK
ncbi:acyltransferase [Mesorhizobium sp. B2-4-14]|uniref:acyltransferase family protein n=1 Tax=Mesorhizobium sp. B2-4-14 TaxID=2589935 RepID=UPI0015E34F98|nr:acyltransferase [Mesorhizobium sp. B2-4-14]